ncbi:MAG: ArsR/SmtB family transcription factor [Actinomycetota bacterium]
MAKRQAAKRPAVEDEPLVIKDASTLKALAEPTRLQILLELGEGAKTVKEVAAALGVSVTGLYYHFKILERAKLIRVSARRMVSGIEERSYEATAKSWTPAPEPSSSLAGSGIVDALLEVVRAELELALGAQTSAPLGDARSPVPVMSFTRLALTQEQVAKVQRHIEDVMLEFGETGPAPEGSRLYHALFAAYQAPAELRDRQQP